MTRKVVAEIKIVVRNTDSKDCAGNCPFLGENLESCIVFGKLNPDNSRRHKNCLKAEVKKCLP
jgi:hypothetical protein